MVKKTHSSRELTSA